MTRAFDVQGRKLSTVQSEWMASNDLSVLISIDSVRGKSVQSGESAVKPVWICDSSLQFVSALNLPINGNYTVQLQVTISGRRTMLLGRITWRRKDKKGYMYNCQFTGGQLKRLHWNLQLVLREWLQMSTDERRKSYERSSMLLDNGVGRGLLVDVIG
ncbi:hypothetical protein DFQ01_13435 [Paenibacillus cellulosilyticus]|uniref:PilZ domain-containing protein n=1 Tax=Paenibacillus cellulosilyticus TaxID=375489 RepID=A0A2V2YL32_9BACL|nr:hypothetical protein [Paenibacillus cellulosilyticus]PWV93796.1 hypothetical protein DFQ01_13435 [Paenibacillus cellulosilyticus]QKS47413.1 hypothetical protein HUB94_23785 [Paenibacillus cellulosilyticus]